MTSELLKRLLKKAIKEDQTVLDKVAHEMTRFPEGNLRISSSRGNPMYYYVQPDGTEKYLRKCNITLIRNLAQKKYEEKLAKEVNLRLHIMQKLLRVLEDKNSSSVFEMLSDERKALVNPLLVSDEEYAQWWQTQKYVGKTFKKDVPFLLTDRGEKVRSKSELIIANALARNNVPYRYEFPYLTPTHVVVYPDFTVLNVKTRDEFIFEHFGMMNSSDYLEQTLAKLEMYSNTDFFNGRKLVATFESEGHPLNTAHLERIIKNYFL